MQTFLSIAAYSSCEVAQFYFLRVHLAEHRRYLDHVLCTNQRKNMCSTTYGYLLLFITVSLVCTIHNGIAVNGLHQTKQVHRIFCFAIHLIIAQKETNKMVI